jgi:uncharacterized protein (DUF1800 family)
MPKMDRRSFLLPHRRPGKSASPIENQLIDIAPETLERFSALEAARAAAPPNTGLNPYTGPWTISEVTHLLRRTLFGVTRQDAVYFLAKTMDQSVNELLNAAYTPPDPPVNDYNDISTNVIDPVVPFGETWVTTPINAAYEGYKIESLRAWWFRLMLRNDRSIHEKMTLFWANHMPIQFGNVPSAGHNYQYLNVMRTGALGNFKTLVKNVTLNPAMLYYLNGYLNSASAPDENYGREVQELFVIGKDLTPHYTEDDVKTAARLLTGWRITPTDFSNSFFDPTQHDSGNKQFSSFYNGTIIQGQADVNAGTTELSAFLDMLFAHPETARFVCRKLYRFFVYHNIDPTTEQNVIEPLAQIFRDNNYDILPVLSTLFKSEHFFDQLNRGAIIKSPLDHIGGFLRETGADVTAVADLHDRYNLSYFINIFMSGMLQSIGDPPNVAGWQAYYEKPVLDKLWINSVTLPKRGQFSEYLMFVGLSSGTSSKVISDILGLVSSLSDPSDPNLLISDLVDLLLGLPVTQTVQTYLKSILLSNLPSDYYWTLAWSAYQANPNDPVAKGEVNNRLLYMMNVLLQMEEYQLM